MSATLEIPTRKIEKIGRYDVRDYREDSHSHCTVISLAEIFEEINGKINSVAHKYGGTVFSGIVQPNRTMWINPVYQLLDTAVYCRERTGVVNQTIGTELSIHNKDVEKRNATIKLLDEILQ